MDSFQSEPNPVKRPEPDPQPLDRLGGPTPDLRNPSGKSSGLGNLAQQARDKHLGQARNLLLFIGVIMVLFNAFQLFTAREQARREIDKEIAKLGPNAVVDQAQVRQLEATHVAIGQMVYGGTILLGVVFLVLGLLVKTFPVPTTIIGLFLYVAVNVFFAWLDLTNLAAGFIFKIFFVIGLIKAVQAAIASERERSEASYAPEFSD